MNEAATEEFSMLEATYVHAPGIGRITEKRLWDAGAHNWETYLGHADSNWPLSKLQRDTLTPVVEESQSRLESEDYAWFADRLPSGEHWRAIPAFGHRLAFLDIETNGGLEASDLTIVGVHDGSTMRQFVQGANLRDFPEAIADAAILVTFFGSGFDLPFLRRAFPAMRFPQMHVDLCFLYRRLGMRGGLKAIETRMGMRRSPETTGLDGWDAVRLWREYQNGRRRSLETLLAYNDEDVRNMIPLLKEGYRRMALGLRPGP